MLLAGAAGCPRVVETKPQCYCFFPEYVFFPQSWLVRDLVHWGVLLSDLLWGCPFVWFHVGKCWRGLGCYWAGFPARKGCQGAPCCWGAAWWGAKGGKKQQDMACVTPGLLLGLCAQCHIPFYVCKNASTGLHSVKCHGWSSCIGDCRVCVYIYI